MKKVERNKLLHWLNENSSYYGPYLESMTTDQLLELYYTVKVLKLQLN